MANRNKSARSASKFDGKQQNGQGMVNECTGKSRSTSSNDNGSAEVTQSGADGYTDKQIADAARNVAKVRYWRVLNSQLYAKLVAFALHETAHERRFSVQKWIEEIRNKDYVDLLGNPMTINNSYAPIFARMLVAEYPEVRGYIELRKSIYDVLIPDAFETADDDDV